jgi:hypothetical protein
MSGCCSRRPGGQIPVAVVEASAGLSLGEALGAIRAAPGCNDAEAMRLAF